jgi:peptidoglycan/xylan/chitin deacetylase (PgdA/CDA1 family)
MTRSGFYKASLDVLSYSGAPRLFRNILGGCGAIFMLHHVIPGACNREGFLPNAGLEVTPEFLDAVIRRAKSLGYELVSLEDAAARLARATALDRPFAVFTLDDGYLDNLEHALPVFRSHECPFTVFVSPAIIDGTCELWWRGLEAVIRSADLIETRVGTVEVSIPTSCAKGKQEAFDQIYWPLRALPEREQRAWIRETAGRYNIDLEAQCRALAMNWDQVRQMAADPYCSIGAHTVNHFALAKLTATEAAMEIRSSRDRLEREIRKPVKTFAYPYGDAASAAERDFDLVRDLGFSAAVTTRKGLVYPRHAENLMALPRVSLNGGYQKLRYLDVLLSGLPFAIWNTFRPSMTS